jgi:hypothetical protein
MSKASQKHADEIQRYAEQQAANPTPRNGIHSPVQQPLHGAFRDRCRNRLVLVPSRGIEALAGWSRAWCGPPPWPGADRAGDGAVGF